jgi:hypothetical protein
MVVSIAHAPFFMTFDREPNTVSYKITADRSNAYAPLQRSSWRCVKERAFIQQAGFAVDAIVMRRLLLAFGLVLEVTFCGLEAPAYLLPLQRAPLQLSAVCCLELPARPGAYFSYSWRRLRHWRARAFESLW